MAVIGGSPGPESRLISYKIGHNNSTDMIHIAGRIPWLVSLARQRGSQGVLSELAPFDVVPVLTRRSLTSLQIFQSDTFLQSIVAFIFTSGVSSRDS